MEYYTLSRTQLEKADPKVAKYGTLEDFNRKMTSFSDFCSKTQPKTAAHPFLS